MFWKAKGFRAYESGLRIKNSNSRQYGLGSRVWEQVLGARVRALGTSTLLLGAGRRGLGF